MRKFLRISNKYKYLVLSARPYKIRNPPKVQSHICANINNFTTKIQINLIFFSKFLRISNICSTFAGAKAGLDPEQVILSK